MFSNGEPLRTTDLECSWKANGLIIKSHKPQTQKVIFYCISLFSYPYIFVLLYDEEEDAQIYEKFAYLCFGKICIIIIAVTRDKPTSSSCLLLLKENSQRINQLSNRALMDTVNSTPRSKRHRKYLKGYRCWKYNEGVTMACDIDLVIAHSF